MTAPVLHPSEHRNVAPAERRTSVRFRSNLQVFWQLDENISPDPKARVKDISSLGIGLFCNGPLNPGTILKCKFLHPTTRFTCTRPVRVLRVTAQADDQLVAGCQFDRELAFSELLGLL
jgi:PilZ domain